MKSKRAPKTRKLLRRRSCVVTKIIPRHRRKNAGVTHPAFDPNTARKMTVRESLKGKSVPKGTRDEKIWCPGTQRVKHARRGTSTR
jgi:hypothetical protein